MDRFIELFNEGNIQYLSKNFIKYAFLYSLNPIPDPKDVIFDLQHHILNNINNRGRETMDLIVQNYNNTGRNLYVEFGFDDLQNPYEGNLSTIMRMGRILASIRKLAVMRDNNYDKLFVYVCDNTMAGFLNRNFHLFVDLDVNDKLLINNEFWNLFVKGKVVKREALVEKYGTFNANIKCLSRGLARMNNGKSYILLKMEVYTN